MEMIFYIMYYLRLHVSDCQALQVWGLIRHGTRYLKEAELSQLNLSSLNGIRDEIVKHHNNDGKIKCI